MFTKLPATASLLPDSKIPEKSDPTFETISSSASRLPYIDILQQVLIDHTLCQALFQGLLIPQSIRQTLSQPEGKLSSDKSWMKVIIFTEKIEDE